MWIRHRLGYSCCEGNEEIVRSILQKIAIGVIVIASMVLSVKHLSDSTLKGTFQDDPVADFEHKVVKLKDGLPANVGEVGYISDWDVPGISPDPNLVGEYILIQYSMAPVIVVRGMDFEWIIGNLTPDSARRLKEQSGQNYQIKYYDYGLYLIHRIAP